MLVTSCGVYRSRTHHFSGGYDLSTNRSLQKVLCLVGMATKPFKPARHRTEAFQFFLPRFCLTFTANLSKKIHAKNLKIFFRKHFRKKTCFWSTKNLSFGGGGEVPGKIV